jgi:hypothetical protein
MIFGHLLPSIQLQSLEWTRTSFEQPLAEFYTILLEELLQVALEMVKVLLVSQTDQNISMMLKSGDCACQGFEVHHHALQTMT